MIKLELRNCKTAKSPRDIQVVMRPEIVYNPSQVNLRHLTNHLLHLSKTSSSNPLVSAKYSMSKYREHIHFFWEKWTNSDPRAKKYAEINFTPHCLRTSYICNKYRQGSKDLLATIKNEVRHTPKSQVTRKYYLDHDPLINSLIF